MTNDKIIEVAQGLISNFKTESDFIVDFCNSVIKAVECANKLQSLTEAADFYEGCEKCQGFTEYPTDVFVEDVIKIIRE